jgi:hypothetical protein
MYIQSEVLTASQHSVKNTFQFGKLTCAVLLWSAVSFGLQGGSYFQNPRTTRNCSQLTVTVSIYIDAPCIASCGSQLANNRQKKTPRFLLVSYQYKRNSEFRDPFHSLQFLGRYCRINERQINKQRDRYYVSWISLARQLVARKFDAF